MDFTSALGLQRKSGLGLLRLMMYADNAQAQALNTINIHSH